MDVEDDVFVVFGGTDAGEGGMSGGCAVEF